MTAFHARYAWLGGDRVDRDVSVEVAGERIVSVRTGHPPEPDAVRLPGLLLPGFANVHSHAFHRALRGRTHAGAADFWAWRQRMYEFAARLEPDSLFALARAVYGEMALAGITTVGEFHYVHHPPTGGRYTDPNAMGRALLAAAEQAGVRIRLLDTCYLQADVDGAALHGVQRRFDDGGVGSWLSRVDDLPLESIGAAVHSVRALPPDAMRQVAAWAVQRAVPLHLHLSEQRRENDACRAVHGCSPAQLAADTGVLGRRTTAVHATWVDAADIAVLRATGSGVCLCPTTEADLADGVGSAADLAAAGVPLSLGSDSQAVVDLLAEARAVELGGRLVSGRRGCHRPADLLAAATAGGAAALGWPADGRLVAGGRADLVALRLDTPRLAGVPVEDLVAGAVFAGSAADVSHVVAAGRLIVADGRHLLLGDVPAALGTVLARL